MSTHTEITWCTRFYSLLPFKGRWTFITIHPLFSGHCQSFHANKPPLKQEYFDISQHHNQTINCAHGSRLERKSSCDLRKEKSIFDYKFHAILQNTFAFSYVCCSSFVVWLFTHSLFIWCPPWWLLRPTPCSSFHSRIRKVCCAWHAWKFINKYKYYYWLLWLSLPMYINGKWWPCVYPVNENRWIPGWLRCF